MSLQCILTLEMINSLPQKIIDVIFVPLRAVWLSLFALFYIVDIFFFIPLLDLVHVGLHFMEIPLPLVDLCAVIKHPVVQCHIRYISHLENFYKKPHLSIPIACLSLYYTYLDKIAFWTIGHQG